MIKEIEARHMGEAKRSLETFKIGGGKLQKTWDGQCWSEIDRAVDEFCKASQGLNMSLGGFDVEAFDEAASLLNEFITYANDLLEDARRNESLPANEVLIRMQEVVERCKLRVVEFTRKRDDIPAYQQKVAAIIEPNEYNI